MKLRERAATVLSFSHLFGVLLVLSLAAAAYAQAPAGPSAAAAKAPAVIKPGDNLFADGIPEIPAEIAELVGRYTEFRSAALASWHPTTVASVREHLLD